MTYLLTLLLLLCPVLSWAAATPATLPQVLVDTSTYPVVTGTVRCVPAAVSWTVATTGCITHYAAVQAAIDVAVGGDEIRIDPAWTETAIPGTEIGPTSKVVLKNRGALTSYILIRTANYASLPARGTRITPATHAAHMPKFKAKGGVAALATNVNANHYWITGIEFSDGGVNQTTGLVELGKNNVTFVNPTNEAQLSSNIILDRVYVHGTLDPATGVNTGIFFACAVCSVEDSVIRYIHGGPQSHALWLASGSGIKIHNNYIDGTGQNIFVGAHDNARPSWPENVRNVTVTHNHMRKDQVYLDNPAFDGCCGAYSMLIEFKAGILFLFEGNIIEKTNSGSNPLHGDWAITLKSEDQNGDGVRPLSDVSDITFRYNIIRHAGSAVQSAYGQGFCCYTQMQPKRHTFHDNLFYDIGTPGGAVGEANPGLNFGGIQQSYGNGGGGASVLFVSGTKDLIFRHNTVLYGRDISKGWVFFFFAKFPRDGVCPPDDPALCSNPHYLTENIDVIDNILPLPQEGAADNHGFNNATLGAGIPTIFNNMTTSTATHNLFYVGQRAQNYGAWATSQYPTNPAANSNNNIYEAHTDFNVGFANATNMVNTTNPLDFVVTSGTGNNSASDGLDRGANLALVVSKTAGVEAGTTTGAVTPGPAVITIPSGKQLTIGSGKILKIAGPPVALPPPPAGQIQFSGRNWIVKSYPTEAHGPGPNFFSNDPLDVYVDAQGRLHMRIAFRGGKWWCTELISADVVGYGTYTWSFVTKIDNFDPRVVLGLFTWDDTGTHPYWREIDIELSRWGNAFNPTGNNQFVVQPDAPHRFLITQTTDLSTQSFTWGPASASFISTHNGNVTNTHTWSPTSSVPVTGGTTNARINFWLFQGVPPANGLDHEVILDSFTYTPS